MDLQLNGKAAIVLAASKGLGKATAVELAREGCSVAIGSRNDAELQRTAEEIRASTGAKVFARPVDVTRLEQAQEFVAAALAEFGRLDILVNNAGGPPFGKFESFDDATWLNAFELNLLSAVRFTRLALPELRKSGNGRIVNIVSLSVKTVIPGAMLSTAVRVSVVALAKNLADEVGVDGITVNNVASGIILTDRVRQAALKEKIEQGMSEEEGLRELAATIPVKRVGKPDELAALVTFLSSPRAAYITGATIPVDGGLTRAVW